MDTIVVGGRHFCFFVLAGCPPYILYTYLIYYLYTLCIYTTVYMFGGPPVMSKTCPPTTMMDTGRPPRRCGSVSVEPKGDSIWLLHSRNCNAHLSAPLHDRPLQGHDDCRSSHAWLGVQADNVPSLFTGRAVAVCGLHLGGSHHRKRVETRCSDVPSRWPRGHLCSEDTPQHSALPSVKLFPK